MSERPIAVIVPTLNEEAALPGFLESLAKLPDVQVIVSDGGSMDKTLNICREHGVKIVKSYPGRGIQLNGGAVETDAPILLFLHADSRIDTDLLKEIMRFVEQGAAWGCATLEFDNRALFYRMLALFSNLRSRIFNSCYGDQAIFCRSDFYQEIGGYPDWPLLEDVEFSRRARRRQRARITSAKVTTSARRFENRGRWKSLFLIQWIKILFWLGVKPQQLDALYRNKKGIKACRQLL